MKTTKTIKYLDFKDAMQDGVLKGLDEVVREITGQPKFLGATDAELPDLFRALDDHIIKVADRIRGSILDVTIADE